MLFEKMFGERNQSHAGIQTCILGRRPLQPRDRLAAERARTGKPRSVSHLAHASLCVIAI